MDGLALIADYLSDQEEGMKPKFATSLKFLRLWRNRI